VRRTRLCNTGEIEDIYREDCWRRFGEETISLADSECVWRGQGREAVWPQRSIVADIR